MSAWWWWWWLKIKAIWLYILTYQPQCGAAVKAWHSLGRRIVWAMMKLHYENELIAATHPHGLAHCCVNRSAALRHDSRLNLPAHDFYESMDTWAVSSPDTLSGYQRRVAGASAPIARHCALSASSAPGQTAGYHALMRDDWRLQSAQMAQFPFETAIRYVTDVFLSGVNFFS